MFGPSRRRWPSLRTCWMARGQKSADGSPSSSAEREGDEGHRLYKIMSWDDHDTMALDLVLQLHPSREDFGTVRRHSSPEEPEKFLPGLAAIMLTQTIRLYRTHIGGR